MLLPEKLFPQLFQFLNRKQVARVAFILLIACGIFIFQDYGIGWDEPSQIDMARRSYDYAFHNDTSFLHFKYRDYGMAFDMPLYAVQQYLPGLKEQYTFKHFMVHLFFLLAVYCFYKINQELFKRNAIAFLACTLLVLSPRIYADSFHNSKDLAFISAFIIGFYTYLKFFKNYQYTALILHGVVCAFLVNIRIIGLLLVAATLVNLLIDASTGRTNFKQFFKYAFIFSISFCVALIISWPYLWPNPLHNFISVIKHMKHYDYFANMIYRGHKIRSTELPWHYLFTWIGITTPLLYLCAFFTGSAFLTLKLLTKFKQIVWNPELRHWYVVICLAVLPVISVILSRSVLYDAWRHLFFIYPFMIIVSVYGLIEVYRWLNTKNKQLLLQGFCLLVLLNLSYIALQMIYYHPHQNAYFNHLVSHKKNYIRHNYEMDYWGLSYKQGLNYLVNKKHPKQTDTLNILVDNEPGSINLDALDKADKGRIKLVKTASEADYYLTNYRRKNFDITEFPDRYKDIADDKIPEEIYAIYVHNSSIMSVFAVKNRKK
jgi:hypothetical protein